MLELIGVDGLTQWDVGRQVNVDKDVDMVHFSNRPYGYSKNVKVTDGVADVPDMFLTSCAPLRVWAYVGDFEKGYTKIEKIYEVKPKNRPEDYIYTPEEIKTWEKLQSEIGNISDLATEAKENLVAAINEVAANMSEGVALDTTLTQSGQAADAKAVGDALAGKQPKGNYLTQDNLQSATDAVLAQAKASGEFDGADGKSAYQYAQDGGYTGTETEFAEKLATDIPSALPNPNALTFTGAVTGSYDGTAPMTVNIPSGGSSGTDISLGLTSAAVGQIIKVKAIDESGKPTVWEAADMPSGGGHWETVLDTVWEQDVINPTAFDSETGIFTCASGELNNLELNKGYIFFQQCAKEGVAFNTILNNNIVKVTKLSDTTFSIDATPPTTFVPTNVKFSKGACLAITDIDAKKIRLTLDGQFGATATKYNSTFYGASKPYFAENVGYVAIENAYHAYQQVTVEVESPYRIVGEILCGFNAPSKNGNFHFKNNSFCCPLIPYDVPEGNTRKHFLTSDGTKIAKLYSTNYPWHLGTVNENTAISGDYLKIISGTKVKLERWVE